MPRAPEIYLDDPWFRCISAVGFALLHDGRDIFVQTDEEDGRNWLDVIGLLEKQCLLAREQGFSNEPDYLVLRAKEDFATIAERFREENPGLQIALLKLAKTLRPPKPKEVLATFRTLNDRGLILTRECASKWGGRYAKSRAARLKAFPLSFDEPGALNGVTPVCSWTDTSSRTIHLTIGAVERPLVNFLCFEFYLFHEYLSHVLPTWEDPAGKLSEGYLFSIARWWYTKTVDQMDSALVAVDWQEHWQRQKLKSNADYWQMFHRRSDWFEAHASKEWFARLLLEIAAFDQEGNPRFQPDSLSYLNGISRHGMAEAIEALSANSALTVEEICDQFRTRLKQNVGHKTLKRIHL